MENSIVRSRTLISAPRSGEVLETDARPGSRRSKPRSESAGSAPRTPFTDRGFGSVPALANVAGPLDSILAA